MIARFVVNRREAKGISFNSHGGQDSGWIPPGIYRWCGLCWITPPGETERVQAVTLRIDKGTAWYISLAEHDRIRKERLARFAPLYASYCLFNLTSVYGPSGAAKRAELLTALTGRKHTKSAPDVGWNRFVQLVADTIGIAESDRNGCERDKLEAIHRECKMMAEEHARKVTAAA